MQVTPDLMVGSAIGLIGSALYGLSVVVYRSQADAAGPIEVSAIKMWVALPFMVIMTLLLPGIEAAFLPLATIWLLSLSVLFGAVIGDTIYLWSQARIGVSYAFPIAMSFPILTFFMTVGFLGESFILSRLIGVVIAVIGIILISNEQNKPQQDNETSRKLDLLGILGAILTALLYAVGTTVLQVGIEGVDPIAGNLIRVVVGSVAFLPVIAAAAIGKIRIPSKRATTYIIIAAFFGMAVGSLLYVAAVAMTGATIISVISSTAPLYAVPVSVFFLKEKLTKVAGVGILATIVGVVLVVVGL